ncbi:MAG: hypothetical protein K5989_11465 [Lachnospiraceae bacterium]|nr:hypothetical protein [Lachnospiraceae bacterium]
MPRTSLTQKKQSQNPLEGGINANQNIQRSASMPNLTNVMHQDQAQQNVRGQQQNARQNQDLEHGFAHLIEDNISEIPMEENHELQENGREILQDIREIDLQEVQPEIAEEKEEIQPGMAQANEEAENQPLQMNAPIEEQEIPLDQSLDDVQDFHPPVRAYVNQLKKELAEKNKEAAERHTSIKANKELSVFKKTVKQGRFNDASLAAGVNFLRKVDRWAGRSEDPDDDEKAFYRTLGGSSTLKYLYVDGVPLREYVRNNYDYQGSRDAKKDQQILSAYAAMIAARQNHAITMMRPVLRNGVADIDIRNVDTCSVSQKDGRNKKIEAARYRMKGNEYVDLCKRIHKSTQKARACAALRKTKNITIDGLKKIEDLNKRFRSVKKGSHQNYNTFTIAFDRYIIALESIGSDPAHMNVDKETLLLLDRLCSKVILTANDYLKDKNMKEDRHIVIRDIRTLMSSHSGSFLHIRGIRL